MEKSICQSITCMLRIHGTKRCAVNQIHVDSENIQDNAATITTISENNSRASEGAAAKAHLLAQPGNPVLSVVDESRTTHDDCRSI